MKFRKKPVVVEAIQYTGKNFNKVKEFCPCIRTNTCFSYLSIPTLEGLIRADMGDWIIKGVKGEFYPCKSDIFEATYEPVEE
jgi:hypothetical protein